MVPISIMFSTILGGCTEKETTDTSNTTSPAYQTDLVDHTYECEDDEDWCYQEVTTVTLEIGEFESYLGIDNQLSEDSCLDICIHQSVPANYNVCGCSYDGENDLGDLSITCITYECAVEGRGHGDVQKAQQVSGPTAMARWFARAFHAEASSVGAFLQLQSELTRHHAPQELLVRCMQAAKEEVMHARMMSKYCADEGGKAPTLEFGDVPDRSLFELALDNAVEGCIFETYAALRAHYQAKNAQDTRVRKMMKVIARDETKHAQLAWDIHQWLFAQLNAEQQEQLKQAQKDAYIQLQKSADRAAMSPMVAQLGLPSPQLAKDLCQRLAA